MIDNDSVHILKVTLWLERSASEEQENEWRGEVHRLETGEKSYFRHFDGFAKSLEKVGIKND